MTALNTLFPSIRLLGFTAACSVLMATSALAAGVDPQVEGAKLCTKQIPSYERQYNIPQHLLSAISSTESGRWHNGLNIVLPWPWTINAEGKGYYFNTKQEAVIAARNMQLKGVKSMDIGCMQVNLLHHPDAFRNLEEAFDPQHNVAYAANFLRSLYESEGTWRKAAAAYHSKTPVRGSQYVSRVFSSWSKIIDRLNMAKTVIAKADVPSNSVITTKPKANVKPLASLAKAKPAREPVKMKVIEVSSADKKKDNIFVVRPEYSSKPAAEETKPLVVASVEEAVAPVAAASKVIYLSGQAANNIKRVIPDTPASGPRFIFSD